MAALARIRMLQKVLRQKYGIMGEVAAKYLESGARVRIGHPTRHGEVHILVYKDGARYAIEVFSEPRTVPREVVENLLRKAKLLNAKPILVLYGDGPKLSEDVYQFCRDQGVKIRRMKAR
ncbi:MAG: hypothetical protein GXO32_08685 [Crenarchaeota archaeon]|nr:hypothetical protein [Thermoproteota archaeon]